MSDLILMPAGVLVGIVNAVAGGGSLVSFPLFLLLGYSPFVSNVSNSVGVFPSNFGAVWGYRREIKTIKSAAITVSAAMIAGTLIGIALLLASGDDTFEKIVPWLMGLSAVLILVQPIILKKMNTSHGNGKQRTPLLVMGTFIVGIYGGYFGPGLGVMLLAVLGLLLPESLQRINAVKNVAAVGNNALCVIAFSAFAHIAWTAALSMGAGSTLGGIIGGHIARRLPDRVFRIAVVVIGLLSAVLVAVK